MELKLRRNKLGQFVKLYKPSKCIDCDKILKGHKSKRCWDCYKKFYKKENHQNWDGGKPKCIDCGKLLSSYSYTRCQKCFRKFQKGENHPNWKGGKPKCSKCKKFLTNSKSTLCFDCYHKIHKGKNHHNWKERPKCIGCGRELDNHTSKRCADCRIKYRKLIKKLKQNYCIDCGKPCYKTSTRCKNCDKRWRSIPENNPLFGKKGKDNPLFGKKRKPLTKDHREKISNKLKKRYKDKTNHPLYKKKRSKETKKKLSLKAKERFKDKTKHPMYGRKQKKESIEKFKLKRRYFKIPFKDTSIEIAMQNELKQRNIPFITHKPIFGQPDIFIKPNICIFCDGDYWHSNPNRFPQPINEHQKNSIKRDLTVNNFLRNIGYKVFRYWESEINANVEGCVDEIEDVLYLNGGLK